MTDRGFDRIAEAFLADGPTVLPDRVFEAAFEEVHGTHQRRVLWRMPWRTSIMNTYAKLAVAGVAVIAIGLVGLSFLGPTGTGGGGAPVATPSPTIVPSPSPTAAPSPTPTPAPTAAPLTGQFTSNLHGFSIAVPAGWTTTPATTPWTTEYVDGFSTSADLVTGPDGHGFLALASQPLGDRTPAEWEADTWQIIIDDEPANEACQTAAQAITLDGASGVYGCDYVLVTSGGRGYWIRDFLGDDPPWDQVYDQAFFRSILDTMQFRPDEAVDSLPSPAPS